MSSGIHVVERIEDDGEAVKPLNVELGLLDVGMMRDDLDIRVESLRRFLRDLSSCQLSSHHAFSVR